MEDHSCLKHGGSFRLTLRFVRKTVPLYVERKEARDLSEPYFAC